ncbi:MAG: tRNA (N(6)-L-threonylcarbamoyladenosine(37)-C(2))-methylthiotransferase MtaB [Desulfobacteraceae bacterium]
MGKTFKIMTLGCKVNQYESTYLKEALFRAGWSQASKGDRADASIINTCIVTQRASYQSRQALRRAIRENPSGIIVAVGCYAQVFPHELSEIEGVDLIAGNTTKSQLPEIMQTLSKAPRSRLVLKDFSDHTLFDFLPIEGASGRTRAFLKIQDGCESFCSFCIVPFARGPLRSLDPDKVISMLRSMSEEGYKEVVLTGIHLGKYGVDLGHGIELKQLLALIGKEKLPLRIRLSSIEPKEVDRELIAMVASEEWLCRHFHIPLQSGDNRILKRMNRDYTALEFARLIEDVHKKIPFVATGVDAMAGFPGEDDRAYQNTYSLIQNLPVSYLHVFPFSPREGTRAASFAGQVHQKEVKERTAGLRELGEKKRMVFHQSCLGKSFAVLTEGWESEDKKMIRGLSDNYLRVIFLAPQLLQNEMIPVTIEKMGKHMVIGSRLHTGS